MKYGLLLLLLPLLTCSKSKRKVETQVIISWNQMALNMEVYNPNIAVPIAARFYGFNGFIPLLTHAYSKNNVKPIVDLFPYLNLKEIIVNEEVDQKIIMNEAYHYLYNNYFVTLHNKTTKEIRALYEKWDKQLSDQAKNKVVVLSKKIGVMMAQALVEWAKKDSVAYKAELFNFDYKFIPPIGEGLWTMDSEHPMPALLPYWGKVKPFVIKQESISFDEPAKYSTDHTSEYYSEALEIFTISSPLSYENKWIAEFWSDDVRGLTFTPVGRWISITCQLIEEGYIDEKNIFDIFFKIGIGMSDASVICWQGKYKYNIQRPIDYIRKNINDGWRSFHDTPNFPAYPSGHSMFGSASTEILQSYLTDKNFEFTDNSHKNREEFIGKPRSYTSLSQMSTENAYSRIPLGVHFRMDCKEGLRLGKEIGKIVNKINFE